MRKILVASVATAAISLGFGATAQQQGGQPGAPASAQQERTPAGQGATGATGVQTGQQDRSPGGRVGQQDRAPGERTGQDRQPGERMGQQDRMPGERVGQDRQPGERVGQDRQPGERVGQQERAPGERVGQGQQDARPGETGQDRVRADQPGTAEQRATTRQDTTGATGTQVQINQQQRTQIRQHILQTDNVPRVRDVQFNVSIGTTIPVQRLEVRPRPLPRQVIEIVPTRYRDYHYIVIRDDIVIVEPDTYRVVLVISG